MNPQITTKICTKCKIEKPITDFSKQTVNKDGLQYKCKNCVKEYDNYDYLKNKEQHRKNNKLYALEHKDEIKLQKHQHYLENIDEITIKNRKYALEHNHIRIKSRNKWKINNPDKFKEVNKKASAKKNSTTKGNLDNRMSCGVYKSLKSDKAGRRWETLVGYSFKDLQKHIELLFWDEMSWKIFTKEKNKIPIHHLISRSSFKYTSAEDPEFKKCWALENLIPMWKADHIEFHRKYGTKTTKEQYDEFIKEKQVKRVNI